MRKKTTYFDSYSAIFVSGTIISIQATCIAICQTLDYILVLKEREVLHASVTPRQSGKHRLPITIHDQDIQGSPFDERDYSKLMIQYNQLLGR